MIQEFSLTNFLSFNDKQTINLLASSDKTHIDELTYEPKKGVRILRLFMIYGANASGKSNILNGIEALWMMLISPRDKEDSKIGLYTPFKLNINKPIEFEIIFWVENRKFKYNIKYNDNEILFEKLEYVTDSGVMSDLYEREIGKDIKFGGTIDIKSKVKNDFNTETLKNHTVLSTLNKKNINAPKILIELYEWIKNSVHELGSHNSSIKIAEYANKDVKVKQFLLDLLCKADFNITDFNVVESKINDDLLVEVLKDDSLPQALKDKILKPQKQVLFTHKNEEEEFQIAFGMQSDGTRAYFRLARLLIELGNNGTVVIEDELEDSLHYDLLLHFIETFLRIEKNSQLIFTTHNQMLLDEDWMLRRDMICFVEKSRNKSNSEVYKASDMGLHKNVSLLNAYKIGKLGAKPNLGSTILNQV
jgi:AAA15 family ATPase/GTPase